MGMESSYVDDGLVDRTPKPISLPHPFGTNVGALPDGALISCYAAVDDEVARVGLHGADLTRRRAEQPTYLLRSRDNGSTWTQPRQIFAYPADKGVVPGGGYVLVDRKGAWHVFAMRYFSLGEVGLSHLLHHVSRDGGETWSDCRRIDFGGDYSGALNSVIQLASGRIVLALSFVHHERKTDPWVTRSVFSDDGGETWNRSNGIEVRREVAHSESGAIEPVMVELRNGLVWMLIRTTTGYLWESFSRDGQYWTPPIGTRLVSSNAPAGIERLRDGRLVLFWNNLYGEPYHGGTSYARHTLVGAISEDEGQTWSVPTTLAQRRDGEHLETQVCYPFPCQTADGSILLVYTRVESALRWNTATQEMVAW